MTLSQEQMDAFARDGYLPYQRILTDEELALLRREYDHEFALAERGGQWRNLAAPDGAPVAEQKKAPQQMLQIMQMCERNLHFRKLIYDARILDGVQDLIGPNLMLFHDQALFKPAYHGGEVPWHQDNAYWQCRPANLVSCWLTLDDVDADNEAMQVIPGSHLRPHRHQKARDQDVLYDLKTQVDLSRKVTVPLAAGACMFHHCQTVHQTNPNTTPRQRRAFAIHFMTPGTFSERENSILHVGWSHPLLRMAC